MLPRDALESIVHVMRALATHEDELCRLDAQAGDGDLGLTVRSFADAIIDWLRDEQPESWTTLLEAAARRIAATSPSTFGTLVAIGLRAAAAQCAQAGEDLGPQDAARAMTAAISEIGRRGGARAAEKTFLDVLVALAGVLATDVRSANLLQELRDAAVAATVASAGLVPQHGRAAWVGERARGIPDAGSVALVRALEALAPPAAPWEPLPPISS